METSSSIRVWGNACTHVFGYRILDTLKKTCHACDKSGTRFSVPTELSGRTCAANYSNKRICARIEKKSEKLD